MKRFYLQTLLLFLSVSVFSQTPILEVTAPSSIAGNLFFGQNITSVNATTTSPAWGYQLKSLVDNVSGDLVIATDSTLTDSTKRLENCTVKGTSSNVKGKYALIARGTCTFSLKAYNAQKAGAIGVIVYSQATAAVQVANLPAGDSAAAVTIPVFLISYSDGQKLIKAVNAGKVSVNYRYPTLYGQSTRYNYATPIKEVSTLQGININASKNFKLVAGDTAQLRTQFKIIEPDGKVLNSALTYGTVGTDPNTSDTTVRNFVFPNYTPTKIGTYKINVTNNKNSDLFVDSFAITNYTFAQDQFQSFGDYVGLTKVGFANSNLILDVGHIFYTGVSTDKATHAIFAINNPDSIPAGDVFTISIYEMTSALLSKLSNATLTYDDLTSATTGINQYVMKSKQKPDSLLTVEFKNPVALNDNSAYMVMVRYDGTANSGNTRSPLYSVGGYNPSSFGLDDAIYLFNTNAKQNTFFPGWGGTPQLKNVVRLAMAGFKPGTIDTKTLEAWAENQVTVFPNPVTTQLTLNFDLQTLNPSIDYLITNVEGIEVKAGQFKNVQTGTQSLNVSNFANGLYFIRLLGSDGWRTKAFVVTK